MKKPIIIVGAGEAGVAAAAGLREGDPEVEVILISDEPVLPYERPPLSKEVLLGEQSDPKPIRPAEWYSDVGIKLRLDSLVLRVDGKAREAFVRTGNGATEKLAYDKLLIATGARVRRLAENGAPIHYLRTSEDGDRLRNALLAAASVGVIGGGVIGLEVAASAAKLGKRVTIFEPAPRLMARAVTPDVSDYLADLHRAAGTFVMTETGPIEVSSSPEGVTVHLGGAAHFVDLCVAGIGVHPNSELAESAGCAVNNGVLVDSCGRTNVSGIYAAGDVASFHDASLGRSVRLEAWQHAGRHGAHVARAMLGQLDDYLEVPWFWTDQLGVNIQVAGLVTGADHTEWRGSGESRTGFHFEKNRLIAVTTINNGRDMRPSIKLLAAQWRGDPYQLSSPTRPLGKIVTDLLTPAEATS
jgi:3-phenylpropionate/trans-cinnamate dioxygenase ferredoxin reductase subunit